MEGFNLFNLAMDYQLRHDLSLSLAIRNLFNAYYLPAHSWWAAPLRTFSTVGEGVNCRLGLLFHTDPPGEADAISCGEKPPGSPVLFTFRHDSPHDCRIDQDSPERWVSTQGSLFANVAHRPFPVPVYRDEDAAKRSAENKRERNQQGE